MVKHVHALVMVAAVVSLMLTTRQAMTGDFSTRDLANELLASRVCNLRFDQSVFTTAIMDIMAETGLPRETVTAQARQLADYIEEHLDTEEGITKASLCTKLRARRPVFE